MGNTPDCPAREVELPSLRLAREARLPGYNDDREYAGFGRARTFDAATVDPGPRADLRDLYGTPDGAECSPGLFAQDPPANSVPPPLTGRSRATPSRRR